MSRPLLVMDYDDYLVPRGTPTCMSDQNFPLVDPLCGRGGHKVHWKTTGDPKLVTCTDCLLIMGSTINEEEF